MVEPNWELDTTLDEVISVKWNPQYSWNLVVNNKTLLDNCEKCFSSSWKNIDTTPSVYLLDLLDDLRPSSPKPGRVERITTSSQFEDDPVVVQRFLKLNVRHITDGQGVVGGVLLVTPNAVMFDPNVSDPLVIEHGPESYGVIAPMEFILNAAIFNDIAHMRVGTGEFTSNTNEKPEVYHPKTCNRLESHSPGKDSLLVKDETFPELGAGSSVDQESNCSTERDDGDAFPKAFDRDLVTPVERLQDSTDGETTVETDVKKDELKPEQEVEGLKSAEERRKSLLDQHWAIPSKDRWELTSCYFRISSQSLHICPNKNHSFACFLLSF